MIKHVLKSGKVAKSIKGHVVKQEDAKSVYVLIDMINRERRKHEHQV